MAEKTFQDYKAEFKAMSLDDKLCHIYEVLTTALIPMIGQGDAKRVDIKQDTEKIITGFNNLIKTIVQANTAATMAEIENKEKKPKIITDVPFKTN